MPKKVNPFQPDDDPFDVFYKTFTQEGGFSSEAIEHFGTFLIEGKFKMNGNIILPDAFPWLAPIYNLRRTDIKSNMYADGIFAFKPAQTGFTTALFLLLLWLSLDPDGLQLAYFFPGAEKLDKFVAERFNPLMLNEKVKPYLDANATNNLSVKRIHESLLSFTNVDSPKSLDADPIQMGLYDEVRLMLVPVINQLEYRYQAQKVVFKLFVSTVGQPGDFMSLGFEKSTQHRWYSKCEGCQCRTSVDFEKREITSRFGADALTLDAPEGLPLADFDPPEFIRETPDGENWEFFCKHTGQTIDPLNGGYVAKYPISNKRPYYGYHFGAFLNPVVTAKKVMTGFLERNDAQFWNSVMARPYVSKGGALSTVAAFEEAVKFGEELEADWVKHRQNGVFGGVDVRTEELHLVVGTEDRITWLEVFQGERTFERLEERCNQLGLEMLLIDYAPQTSLVLPYVRRNKKAYMALPRPGDMVRWKQPQDDLDVEEDVRSTKMVLFNQVLAFQWAFKDWNDRVIGVPASPITQQNFYDRKRNFHASYNVKDDFAEHMRGVQLLQRPKQTTIPGSKEKVIIPNVVTEHIAPVSAAVDPHFAHAYVMYRLALKLSVPEIRIVTRAARPTASLPLQQFASTPSVNNTRTCGTCKHINKLADDAYLCKARTLYVQPDSEACTIKGLYKRNLTTLG